MQLEIGKIYEGQVRNLTKYGAFVEVKEGDESLTGMVHISEVSTTFVNEITDHLTENQLVKVKVLGVNEQGKISLSIKKAMIESAPQEQKQQYRPRPVQRENNHSNNNNNNNRSGNFNSRPPQPPQELTFEDMISRFKQSSEEKICDLKRNIDGKRRNTSRKKL